MRTKLQTLQRAMNCLTNKMYTDCFDVLSELRKQLEQEKQEITKEGQTKHLKLLPQFIDKVADGIKTIHLRKEPLCFGEHEIVNAKTGEPTGVKVEIMTIGRGKKEDFELWEDVIGEALALYGCNACGFDTKVEAKKFYIDYLKDATDVYLHHWILVSGQE